MLAKTNTVPLHIGGEQQTTFRSMLYIGTQASSLTRSQLMMTKHVDSTVYVAALPTSTVRSIRRSIIDFRCCTMHAYICHAFVHIAILVGVNSNVWRFVQQLRYMKLHLVALRHGRAYNVITRSCLPIHPLSVRDLSIGVYVDALRPICWCATRIQWTAAGCFAALRPIRSVRCLVDHPLPSTASRRHGRSSCSLFSLDYGNATLAGIISVSVALPAICSERRGQVSHWSVTLGARRHRSL